jgi:hypothetical protein
VCLGVNMLVIGLGRAAPPVAMGPRTNDSSVYSVQYERPVFTGCDAILDISDVRGSL